MGAVIANTPAVRCDEAPRLDSHFALYDSDLQYIRFSGAALGALVGGGIFGLNMRWLSPGGDP
jgi:hypothetical protein